MSDERWGVDAVSDGLSFWFYLQPQNITVLGLSLTEAREIAASLVAAADAWDNEFGTGAA